MKTILTFFIFLISPLVIAQQSNLIGIYSGNFLQGNFQSDIEFDIRYDQNTYSITFNSLSQNAFGIPAGDIQTDGNILKFALQSDHYRYDFHLTPVDEKKISSLLHIDGNSYHFELLKKNQSEVSSVKSKDIRFRSGPLLLYGTIYYPEKPNGKAIYLVTSSGNQDRSASRADALLFAKEGYISFHIDKRGTGISDGNWELATIPELCEDDLHALEFLHQSEKLAYAHIGIKGSSQGAAKIPYILQKEPKLAFGIVVSCPGSTLLESDLNYWKNRNIESIGKENINEAADMQGAVFQYIGSNISKQLLEVKIEENKSKNWFHNIWIPDLDQVNFDKKLNYSPLPYFQELRTPLLVIQGSEDEIIRSNSLNLIENTIGKYGNKKNKFITLTNANHSMMLVDDSDFKYWQSLHSKYMSMMLKWMRRL